MSQMGQSAPSNFVTGMEELASIPDAGEANGCCSFNCASRVVKTSRISGPSINHSVRSKTVCARSDQALT